MEFLNYGQLVFSFNASLRNINLFKNHIKFYYIEESNEGGKKQNRLVQLIFASRYDRSC